MSSIIKKLRQRRNKTFDPIKIVIAGEDSYISKILRAYVEHISKGPKATDLMKFYLLPICKRTDISLHIASEDEQYRSLFIRSDWKEKFKSQEPFTKKEIEFITDTIKQYIEQAQHVNKLSIGEAYFTMKKDLNSKELTQKSIPFLKLVKIGENKTNDSLNDNNIEPEYIEALIEYWTEGKKVEGKKISKKSKLEFFTATPLPTIASVLGIEGQNRPIPGESFGVRLGVFEKKKKSKGNTTTKKFFKTSRVVVKTQSKRKTFTLYLDSVKWQRVQLISLRPKWPSRVTIFPIASFRSNEN
eukprot:Anaeramoba_flamelloidesc32062_g1_i2.p1 GENE.c32062_g1_i2~~c32062_g1_i2.p1  ORF type:complete len:341 (+),score=60.21 c32062_g1_i2:126-1025(+)